MALALLLAAPAVFAQEETPPEVPFEAIQIVWALTAVTPAALTITFFVTIAGYLSKTPPEQFKISNFVYTLIISFTIGLLTLGFGWTFSMAQTWLADGFLTWYIWKAAKILAARITKLYTPTPTGPPTA